LQENISIIERRASMDTPEKIYDIDLKDIRISDQNVRLTDRQSGIQELAESIKKYGLLQPVVLRGAYGHPPYELIIGQRRLLAHKAIDKETIRAVFSGDVTDVEAKILSLVENMHRAQLNQADKLKAITALYLRYGKDERRVAKELKLPLKTVRDCIDIEERATPRAKHMLRKRKIFKTDLKRVIDAAQGDPRKADRLLDKMPHLSKYEKDRAVEYAISHPKASAGEIIAIGQTSKMQRTIILDLTEEMCEALDVAERKLSMDKESIAAKALSEWLAVNGFLKKAS
jgi:ParB/RepB/Spo0J family partition protein